MPSEEEQIIQMIAQELMAGKSPNEVAGELVQAGVPQNDAYEIVNAVAQQLSARGGGAPRGGGGGVPAPARRHKGHPWITLTMVILVLVLLWLLMKR